MNNHGPTDRYSSASWHNGDIRKQPVPLVITRRTAVILVTVCIAASALFGFAGSMIGYHIMSSGDGGSSRSGQELRKEGYSLQSASGTPMSVQDVTEKAKRSVVEIKTESTVSDTFMRQYVTEGAGSGVIISDDGYILTNYHVISGAERISVTTADGQSYSAKLKGSDSINDLALLKIKADDLSPAVYGNSDELHVGEPAVAIGNPLGELGGTVTSGIISAKDREINIDGKNMNLLQTDSSVNPGNSGGGLFNSEGQLIGIVVAKSSGSGVEGLGFAIPVNTAASVAQQLMDKGYISGQPFTGMSYQEGDGSGLDILLGESSTQVYINSVEGKNAREAGFRPGDMVIAVDRKEIRSFDDLSAVITSHSAGDTVRYTVMRNGRTKDIDLVLSEKSRNMD